jgi:hypothetical protein
MLGRSQQPDASGPWGSGPDAAAEDQPVITSDAFATDFVSTGEARVTTWLQLVRVTVPLVSPREMVPSESVSLNDLPEPLVLTPDIVTALVLYAFVAGS